MKSMIKAVPVVVDEQRRGYVYVRYDYDGNQVSARLNSRRGGAERAFVRTMCAAAVRQLLTHDVVVHTDPGDHELVDLSS